MRKLITIFFVLFCLSSKSQTLVDTTIDGYNAVIWRPALYYELFGNADSSMQCIVFSYGAGETSASYATLRSIGGPLAYIATGGFDGKVVMPSGDTLQPIVIGLRVPTAFPTSGQPKAKLDAIRAAFKVKISNLNYGGFSAGGYAAKIIATEDNYDATPPYGPFTYAGSMKSIVDVMGVIPDDNAQWYDKAKNFARNGVNGGGQYLGFWGTGDGERGIDRFRDSMNAAVSGSGRTFVTSDAHTWTMVHKVWGNPNGTAPLTWNFSGRTLTTWQWVLLQGEDTTQGGLPDNIQPTVDAGNDSTILFVATSIQITGSASDPDGSINSHTWSQISGPSCNIASPSSYTTNIDNMIYGTYVFRLTAVDNNGGTSFADRVVYNGIPCNEAAGTRYTLTPSGGDIYITNGYAQPWRGGDTLDIPAGTYGLIEIDTFGGDPCRPIYIRNTGGQVVVDILRFKSDCHYVDFIGNGDAGTLYGFKCRTFTATRTAWFTARRVEVGPNPSGVGIYWKQDPVDTLNPSHQYGAYINRRVWIDSFYVHNIAGEGMYIGHTGPDGNEETYGRIPQRGDSTWITNCIVDSTDWDGIQLSNARDGCIIANNVVTNFGLIDMGSQRAGIISGGNTNSKVYGNTVSNGTGNGIEAFGYGVIEIYGNTISNVGTTTEDVNGEETIFTNAYLNLVETNPEMTLLIYNNQINYPQPRGAIRCNNDGGQLDTVTVENNKFCFAADPGVTWKDDYIFIGTGYTDTNNILLCPGVTTSTRIRIRKKVR